MDGVAQFGGTDTTRKYSGAIWADCPIEAIRSGLVEGFVWEKEFTAIPGGAIPTTEGAFGDLALFSSTGGTAVTDTGEVGGGLKIGSDGDNEGVGIRQVITPVKINLSNGDFWYEAIVKTSTIADTKHGFFLGLLESVSLTATVPIAADGTLADQNLVGFHRLEGDGDKVDCVYKADGVTQVTVQADAGTLVADTYTKLGMKFVPKRNIGKGIGYLTFYQDGVAIGSKQIPSAAGTDFPNDVFLGFVFAVLNATGTTPGTSTIKKVRMAQLLSARP